MNIIKLLFILVVFTFFSCEPYKPFNSRKEKALYQNIVDNKYKTLDINDQKLSVISLYEVSLSLKDSIKTGLIFKRLDSFYASAYSNKELQLMLKLDRKLAKRGWNVELANDPNLAYKKINSLQELENIIKKIDSSMKIIEKAKVIIDTSKSQKK